MTLVAWLAVFLIVLCGVLGAALLTRAWGAARRRRILPPLDEQTAAKHLRPLSSTVNLVDRSASRKNAPDENYFAGDSPASEHKYSRRE